MGFKRNMLHTSYVFAIQMKEKTTDNVQSYLSGIFTHKGGSIAILSDNGTEFKNTVLNDACVQLGIKRLFSNLFHSQGILRITNVHNFLRRTLTKFLESSDLEWDGLLAFTCYCHNIFPSSNGTKLQLFLMFGHKPQCRLLKGLHKPPCRLLKGLRL